MTYGHLQADCLYTGISSGPNARYRVWEAFTFYPTYLFTYLNVLRFYSSSRDLSGFLKIQSEWRRRLACGYVILCSVCIVCLLQYLSAAQSSLTANEYWLIDWQRVKGGTRILDCVSPVSISQSIFSCTSQHHCLQFLGAVKAAALKQQISTFYPQIQT